LRLLLFEGRRKKKEKRTPPECSSHEREGGERKKKNILEAPPFSERRGRSKKEKKKKKGIRAFLGRPERREGREKTAGKEGNYFLIYDSREGKKANLFVTMGWD